MVSISHEIGEIDIELNPFYLGELFAGMDSQEQMRFLNGLSTSVNEKWCFQCAYIADEYTKADMLVVKKQVINALEDLLEHLKQAQQPTQARE